jgi:hypothetical protein
MDRDRYPGGFQTFGACYLCESEDGPAVAVCHRCGAFVCRDHVVRMVYREPRKPIGLMSPARRGESRVEMICEVCYLNELASRREAV